VREGFDVSKKMWEGMLVGKKSEKVTYSIRHACDGFTARYLIFFKSGEQTKSMKIR
jgi:hypothetical protein